MSATSMTTSWLARRGIASLLLCGLLGATGVAAIPAFAQSDGAIRISTTGTDGDTARSASDPAVAYNSRANEYLIVWTADALATDDETEIFAQRLDPAGALLGTPIRVSFTGTDGDAARDAQNAAVVYNRVTDEYVVTWRSDALDTDEKYEVFAQRISTAGELVGGNFRISFTGGDTDANRDAFSPSIAANLHTGESLIVWSGDPLDVDDDFEMIAQIVGPGGTLVGDNFRVSVTGPEGNSAFQARQVGAVYNPRTRQYLVTWLSDGNGTDNENEIFAQRVSNAGTLLGGNFRVSFTGVDGDAARDAFPPSVTVNAWSGDYLVVWSADPLPVDEDYEIFVQRIGSGGARLGEAIRVSSTGADGDATRAARQANAAYNSCANQYLVTWLDDRLADDVNEVFAQHLGSGGKLLGKNKRVSHSAPRTDTTRDADGFPPSVVYNSRDEAYLVVWSADALATDNEVEVFARHVKSRRPCN